VAHKSTIKVIDSKSLNISKFFLSNAIYSVLVRACGYILRFLTGVLLARILGPESYGSYAYAIMIVAFISGISMLGMDQIPIRFLGDYLEKKKYESSKGMILGSQKLVLFVSLVFTAILFIIFNTYPVFDEDVEILAFFIMCATIPMVALSQTRQSLCRALQRPVLAQIPENIIYPVILLGFLASLNFFNTGVSLTFTMVAIVNFVAWFVAWTTGLFVLKLSVIKEVAIKKPKYEIRLWLSMSPPIVIALIAYLVMARTDIILLERFYSMKEVGIYSVVARVAELIQFIYDAAVIPGASIFSMLYAANDKKKIDEFVLLLSRTIFYGAIPIYLLFIFYSEEIVAIFGAEYTSGREYFLILVTAYFMSGIGGIAMSIMHIIGKSREIMFIFIFFAFFNLGFSLLMIDYVGKSGVAWSYFASLVLMKATLVVRVYQLEKIICLPFRFKPSA
jgi:O-antigen/teichoic acid export membrane protein